MLNYDVSKVCMRLIGVKHLIQRLYFDMRMVYKIIHGLTDIAFDDVYCHRIVQLADMYLNCIVTNPI